MTNKGFQAGFYALVIAGMAFGLNAQAAVFGQSPAPEDDPIVPLPRVNVCGNNIKEKGEECDGSDLGGAISCPSQGPIYSFLYCTSSCILVNACILTNDDGGGDTTTASTGGGGGGSADLTIYDQRNAVVTIPTALVKWYTNKPGTTRVVYDTVSHDGSATDANHGYAFSTVTDGTVNSIHEVTLSALTQGTAYFWRPVSGDPSEKIGTEMTFTSEAPVITPAEPTTDTEPATPEVTPSAPSTENAKAPAKPVVKKIVIAPLPIVLGVETTTDEMIQKDEAASTTPAAIAVTAMPDQKSGSSNYFVLLLIILAILAAAYSNWQKEIKKYIVSTLPLKKSDSDNKDKKIQS